MSDSPSIFGFHNATGPRNGYGKTAPYARGVVSFEHGALTKGVEVSDNCFTVWRDIAQWAIDPTDPDSPTNSDAPPGLENWTVAEARANARVQWPRTSARWAAHPADAYKITNEIGGSDRKVVENLIAFEDEIIQINEEEGHPFTFLVASCAGDSPHWDSGVWQDLFAPHIFKAWGLGHIYSRHAYCGVNDSTQLLMIKNGAPADNNVNRPFCEIEHFLLEFGTCGPIILGETGYVTYPGEPLYSTQMVAYDDYIREHGYDKWIGFQCAFTYGDWWKANIQDSSDALGLWMSKNIPTKWEPSFDDTEPPPDDECGQTPTVKRMVHLLPQDITLEEEQQIVTDFHAAKNSFGYSHDDAIVIQLSGDPERSVVYVWEPERRNQADLEAMDACGVRWEAQYFKDTEPPAPGNPLTGLKLGYLFRYQYSNDYNGGRFNDPRNYGNGLHEGVDADVIGGEANNKTGVLCTYAGVVDRSLDSAGGYGKYVRVQHENNGSVFYTRYCHLDERYVSVGDTLVTGDAVGEVGTTGNVFGEHVHLNLEVPGYGLSGYVVADVVDPAPYLPSDSMSLPPLDNQPPSGKEINLRHYQVGIPTAFRVVKHVDGNGHETNEDVQDMWIDDKTVVMRKNQNGEWYRFVGNYRERLLDTSPGPDSQGTQRVYRMTQDGTVGGRVNPTTINEGKRWVDTTSHHVQFYAKDGCRELPENSGDVVSACEARLEKNVTFNAYGQNLTFDEVVYVMTNNGEEQMYGVYQGQVVGWIGWVATWGRTEPVEIHFNRGVLTQEPNRYCSWVN